MKDEGIGTPVLILGNEENILPKLLESKKIAWLSVACHSSDISCVCLSVCPRLSLLIGYL